MSDTPPNEKIGVRLRAMSQALEALSQALETGTLQKARRMLNNLRPAEIAKLLESLPPVEREIIWELVEPENDGEVLLHVGEEVRNHLIQDMDPEDLAMASEHLDIDDLADFVQSLPNTLIDPLLQSLDQQHRERLESVLSYPEDSAGGMMDTDTITVRAAVTVDVVLRYLRRLGDLPSHTDKLIVVNRHNKYLGTLAINRLLTADPSSTVADLMDPSTEAIPANLPATEVASLFETHDLISAPVVDENRVLLGRITIDDVVDVIREEADHSVLSMAGLADEEDLFAPVLPSARRRAVWLGINLGTAFLASWVVGQFEQTLEQIVAIAVLMNVVASMGGIAGSQTLTLVIRGITLGQVQPNNRMWLLNKELLVGFLNGLMWALVVAVIAVLWFQDINIGVVIAAATIINLLAAGLSGVAIPLILRRMKIDPAIAGSVILTTVTDVVGLFAFLGLATLFLL